MADPAAWITINGAHVPLDKEGKVMGGMGGKALTLGQLSAVDKNYSPDLKAYEKAANSGDNKTLQDLAQKHPDDARFHIHEEGKTNFVVKKGSQGFSVYDKNATLHSTLFSPGKTPSPVYKHLREIQKGA